MGNLFDKVIKPDSSSPVENIVIKYLNWQNQRNMSQELKDISSSPENMIGNIGISGLTLPAKGIDAVKKVLKPANVTTSSAAWLSNSGKEYKLYFGGKAHAYVAEDLYSTLTGEKMNIPIKEKFDESYINWLFNRGWIRKAAINAYEIKELDKKSLNIIRKDVIKHNISTDYGVVIDTNKGTFVADPEKFMKFGKAALKPIR